MSDSESDNADEQGSSSPPSTPLRYVPVMESLLLHCLHPILALLAHRIVYQRWKLTFIVLVSPLQLSLAMLSLLELDKPPTGSKHVGYPHHRVGSFPMTKGDNMEQFFLQKNVSSACPRFFLRAQSVELHCRPLRLPQCPSLPPFQLLTF